MDTSLFELYVSWEEGRSAHLHLTAFRPYPPQLHIEHGRMVGRGAHRVIESTEVETLRYSTRMATVVEHFVQSVREANGDMFPPGAGRIVLAMPLALGARPWERFFGERFDVSHAAFVRLTPSSALYDKPLRFPFGVAVVADHPSVGAKWVDLVFDEYVQKRLPPGIITGTTPAEAIIWHLIGDDSGMMTYFLMSNPAPRLIVLQRSSPLPSDLSSIALAFERGTSAVLVTSAPLRGALAFTHSFYRKVFHNQPLDKCAAIGISESKVSQDEVMLFARPGGELDLLLTRVPLEMALAGPQDTRSTGDPRRRGSRTYLEAPAQERPVPTRQERSTREMLRAATAAFDEERFLTVSDYMQHLYTLEFSGEEHDVDIVKKMSNELSASIARQGSLLEQVSVAAAPVRYTNLTLNDPKTGKLCLKDQSLGPRLAYSLLVEVAPAPGAAQVSMEFDESKLRALFEREERIELDVVVFAPQDEFNVALSRQSIWLPRVGPSTTARFAITPQRVGWCRLRVAVYRKNALIQSVVLRAFASNDPPPAEAVPTIARELDWAASTDLLLLDEMATPVMSIFTNDTPDGSHWIGVFSGDEEAPAELRAGQMRKFDSQDVTLRTKDLREAMQSAHGLPDYRYPATAPPHDPAVVQFGIDTLIELAVRGREVFSYLFQGMTDISPLRLKFLRNAIGTQQNGIISIARCDARWTLPWSALYDYALDVNRRQDLNVCALFLNQLAANEWDESGQVVRVVNDLLSNPRACRAQESCPLQGRNADVTICPFGFWGFRNQIEEPLAQVTASGENEIPPEMKRASFSQSSVIQYKRAAGLRVAAGVFPFEQAGDHQVELGKLLGEQLSWETDRDRVVKLLYDKQGHHIFYFYCHGVTGKDFAIQVGPLGAVHNLISEASLELDRFHWAEGGNPQPLVILIACQSVAASPETMHGLIGFLRNAMASGVIGAEITIDTSLGRLWGYRLISALVRGTTAGESFLQLRHDLLRRHNPLGLAFSLYAPATLHICDDPAGNGACSRYHRGPMLSPFRDNTTSPS